MQRKKQKKLQKQLGFPCIADDSGLCIEILNGWPGVYTARFLGEKATQNQRNEAILKKMENIKEEQRKAKVICVIAYYENEKFMIQKGEIEGKIAKEPKGENGFRI